MPAQPNLLPDTSPYAPRMRDPRVLLHRLDPLPRVEGKEEAGNERSRLARVEALGQKMLASVRHCRLVPPWIRK